MGRIDEVFERLRHDTSFADAVRTDPVGALGGYELDGDDLSRIVRLLEPPASAAGSFNELFTPLEGGPETGPEADASGNDQE